MIYFNVQLNKNKRVEIPWTSIVFKNPIHEESVYVENRITQNANRVFFNLEFAHTPNAPIWLENPVKIQRHLRILAYWMRWISIKKHSECKLPGTNS